jgi:hypothetical protein
VVLLKGGQKRVMIYGRAQKQEGDDKIWDYIACLYPEGNIRPENAYLFDHENIENVYFIGFQDTEEFEFKQYLEQELSKATNKQD